ncbi:HIT finger domain-containing protein [Aulographum hederae CBS 113979]|uniref:Bis(5'-adenosyl)-triphosphatase n=1 Tax=Aulographum hederae CBS 113979 TaxID=1176131 RepID=A0A6G1H2U0_9PEZI|nr:HIT finger domain-containing protein [Aulographum hederae CBS 113979]
MPPLTNKAIHFGSFLVTNQVFHLTPLSFALVNLKPLLPGHVLVCPLRPVPRLRDLSPAEVSDLFLTVQRVGKMIERVYGASALNIAVQDGKDAGQSVGHVHAHIIPRVKGDLKEDEIYERLEGSEGDVGRHLRERNGDGGEEKRMRFPRPDVQRKPRTGEEMGEEAEMLAKEMEKESQSAVG